MSTIVIRETPECHSEDEARRLLLLLLREQSERNPACKFVLAENGLTLYWRCSDGFDYGIYAYTLDGHVAAVWDGGCSLIWRKWRAGADCSTQIAVNPDMPRMPAQPGAFSDETERT